MSKKENQTTKRESKTDSKSELDGDEFVSDEELGNVLRSLTVIYGFFFVFLSAMVAGAQNLRVGVDFTTIVFFYTIVIALAVACFLIGFEIYISLRDCGISRIGDWGVILLILLVPTTFVFVIGQALLTDVTIFGVHIAPFGVYAVSGLELLITTLLLWQARKER